MADYREFSAKTVDDCITDACMTYSVTSDRLDYEVVSEGSAGFIGIGAKNAVIKARVKEESFKEIEEKQAAAAAEKNAEKEEALNKKKAEIEAKKEAEKKANAEMVEKLREKNVLEEHDEEEIRENRRREKEMRDARRGRGRNRRFEDEGAFDNNAVKESKPSKPVKPVSPEDQERLKKVAENFLKELFDAMKIEVKVDCSFDEEYTLNINIEGDDMGLLLGKRGQTLDSVQYITSLVVNKGMDDYVRIKVDTEDYRERRKETLERLARNIAYKVKRTRRPVALEPMNPYERRIIHSALQNDRYVTTHSEGEEPYRKIVVTLKR